MKRKQVVDIIADWAKPEVLKDMYGHDYQEWADNLLYTLEMEYGMLPPPLKCPLHGGGEARLYMWEEEESVLKKTKKSKKQK